MMKILFILLFFATSFANGQIVSIPHGGTGSATAIKQISRIATDTTISATTGTKFGMSFVAAASATYAVDVYIKDSSSTPTGVKFDVYALSAISSISGLAFGSKKSDTCGFDIISADSTLGTAFTTYVPTTNYGVWIAHFTFVNGAATQTVFIRAAKPTSGNAVIKSGSYLEAWKQ